MKLLTTICVIGLALSLATSVYAGTQSVKVSGDLAIRGLFRDKYELGTVNEDPNGNNLNAGVNTAERSWIMSTAEAQVDADLTDNVSTVIRLVNQRDWNAFTMANNNVGTTSLATNGRGQYTENTDEFDVIVDLAYLELKEFLYSPLTLKIGRQDMWFGKGFIVGANQQDPGTNLAAPEYTAVNSFDAIRATLDYDPWTIDAVYSKIYEDVIQANDDVDLLGVNIGYIFDSYNGEAEAYFWRKDDDSIRAARQNGQDTNTIGLRGSADPIVDWTVAAEGAYQFGNALRTDFQTDEVDRSAWAFDLSAECRYLANKYAWKPVLTGEYIYYSGDRHADDLDDETRADGVTRPRQAGSTVGTQTGWDPMYRGKFDTAYREFTGRYYATTDFPARARAVQSVADASFTNQHQALINAMVQPTDSLTCNGRLASFWLDEKISTTRTKKYLGTEFDLTLNWDYTEDVSFGLLGAWFFPGTVYSKEEAVATDIVGTVKLSF